MHIEPTAYCILMNWVCATKHLKYPSMDLFPSRARSSSRRSLPLMTTTSRTSSHPGRSPIPSTVNSSTYPRHSPRDHISSLSGMKGCSSTSTTSSSRWTTLPRQRQIRVLLTWSRPKYRQRQYSRPYRALLARRYPRRTSAPGALCNLLPASMSGLNRARKHSPTKVAVLPSLPRLRCLH